VLAVTAHNRKLKTLTFDIDGTEFQIQCNTWKIVNNSQEGAKQYVYVPNEEFNEESDPDYSLEATFFSDWRSAGISDFCWEHDGETIPVTIDHHPDIPAEHVRWTGEVKIKAPDVGGDVRTTEVTAVTMTWQGNPLNSRP
jgi:hypothetical protein